MKTKIKYLLVLVLASFVLAGCCTMHSKTAQWEYKTVVITGGSITSGHDLQSQLNEAAEGGWKLIVATTPNYIFERPKH